MTDTTTRRPWFQVAPPCGDTFDRDRQVARWLAYAHANMLAFDDAVITPGSRSFDYLHCAIPTFTAAALTRGKTAEWAYDTCVMGEPGEFICQWLQELGVDPDGIAPATDQGSSLRAVLDLHAPKREQYFDAATGKPAGSAVECEYCSEQEGDGVDYPCPTARAAGVTA